MVLEEDIHLMDAGSFSRLEKKVYSAPYQDTKLARQVIERSLKEQCETYTDNIFFQSIKNLEVTTDEAINYYCFKNKVEESRKVNNIEVYKFAENFLPEKKMRFFKLEGKRIWRIKKVQGKANKLLKNLGSEKRLVLWPKNLSGGETTLLYGNCKEENYMGYKTFVFSAEDVFAPHLAIGIRGVTCDGQIVVRTKGHKKEFSELVSDAFSHSSNKNFQIIAASLLQLYGIDNPADLSKEKERLFLEERIGNTILHEVGHNISFEIEKPKIFFDLGFEIYALEVMADFAPAYKEASGPISKMCDVAKKDFMRANRMWGHQFYTNTINYAGTEPSDPYYKRAVINLAYLLLARNKGLADFEKLGGYREQVYSKIKHEPKKVLEESENILKNLSSQP